MNGIGRPAVKIGAEKILNAWARYHSIAAAAKTLNISKGTAWRRLKEAGVTPLGMSRAEAGQLGAKYKMMERAARSG